MIRANIIRTISRKRLNSRQVNTLAMTLSFCPKMTEKYPLYPVEAEITFNKGGRFMSTKMKPEKLQEP